MALTTFAARPGATASARLGANSPLGTDLRARGPANGETCPAAPAPSRGAADDGGRRARAVVRHARWVALATGAGVAAHLGMAADGGWMAALAVAMAAVCAPCAWGMWRRPSVRGARILVGMSLGMALAHAALVLGVAPLSGHAHGHGPVPSAGSSGGFSSAASAALDHASHVGPVLLIVGMDLAAALLAAGWLRRVSRWG